MKRTRIIAVLLTAVMLLAVMPFSAVSAAGNIWDGSVASSFASGSGTEDDPYIITNGAEFAYMSTIDTTGLYFELANDIVLNNTSAENWFETAKDWVYIELYGNFDGKGYTVSGLCYNPDEVTRFDQYVGLFGYAENANIANVNVADAYLVANQNVGGILGDGANINISNCTFDGIIKASIVDNKYGGYYAAGIVGYVYGEEGMESRVSDCINYGDVYVEYDIAGGIAGLIMENCYVENCKNYGNISGPECVGGIVGCAIGTAEVSEDGTTPAYCFAEVFYCENYGTVSCPDEEDYVAGGICGYAFSANIRYSVNYGNVYAEDSSGGIVGYAEGYNSLTHCVNYGEVSGVYAVGGVVGDAYYYWMSELSEMIAVNIYQCVNQGRVKGISDEENDIYSNGIGGIVGVLGCGNVSKSYNYGIIEGGEMVGGIVGEMYGWCVLEGNYNNGNVNGYEDVGGIVGRAYADVEHINIMHCNNKGNVCGMSYVGGILGHTNGEYDVYVIECQNKGTMEGSCCVAGIAGYMSGGKIVDCLNDGTVKIFEDERAMCPCGGGIIGEGYGTYLENCLNVGTNDCDYDVAIVGGIACSYFESIYIINSYYLKSDKYLGIAEYSNINTVDYITLTSEIEGVSAVTGSEIKTEATFEGFSFEDIWYMDGEHPELVKMVQSILGDVDMDGEVGKLDYNMVKRYCFETAELEFEARVAADVNGDGVIDKLDYSLIKRSCFGTAEIK